MHELNEIGTGVNKSNIKAEAGHNSLLNNTSLEVDPNRMNESDDTFSNTLQLQLYAHKIWRAVIESEIDIPTDLRYFKGFLGEFLIFFKGIYLRKL
jgi:hypothetical protein